MAGPSRIKFTDAYYHIISRRNKRNKIVNTFSLHQCERGCNIFDESSFREGDWADCDFRTVNRGYLEKMFSKKLKCVDLTPFVEADALLTSTECARKLSTMLSIPPESAKHTLGYPLTAARTRSIFDFTLPEVIVLPDPFLHLPPAFQSHRKDHEVALFYLDIPFCS